MSTRPSKPAFSRPRPELETLLDGDGGEGGNRAAASSRLAEFVGPNYLLAAALLVSMALVALTATALNPR